MQSSRESHLNDLLGKLQTCDPKLTSTYDPKVFVSTLNTALSTAMHLDVTDESKDSDESYEAIYSRQLKRCLPEKMNAAIMLDKKAEEPLSKRIYIKYLSYQKNRGTWKDELKECKTIVASDGRDTDLFLRKLKDFVIAYQYFLTLDEAFTKIKSKVFWSLGEENAFKTLQIYRIRFKEAETHYINELIRIYRYLGQYLRSISLEYKDQDPSTLRLPVDKANTINYHSNLIYDLSATMDVIRIQPENKNFISSLDEALSNQGLLELEAQDKMIWNKFRQNREILVEGNKSIINKLNELKINDTPLASLTTENIAAELNQLAVCLEELKPLKEYGNNLSTLGGLAGRTFEQQREDHQKAIELRLAHLRSELEARKRENNIKECMELGIPRAFLDDQSGLMMNHPVLASNGKSYEEKNLRDIAGVTGLSKVADNLMLKSLIDRFKEASEDKPFFECKSLEEELIDSVRGEPFFNPVTDNEGQTYDKSAMEILLERRPPRDPNNRGIITETKENDALRVFLKEYMEAKPSLIETFLNGWSDLIRKEPKSFQDWVTELNIDQTIKDNGNALIFKILSSVEQKSAQTGDLKEIAENLQRINEKTIVTNIMTIPLIAIDIFDFKALGDKITNKAKVLEQLLKIQVEDLAPLNQLLIKLDDQSPDAQNLKTDIETLCANVEKFKKQIARMIELTSTNGSPIQSFSFLNSMNNAVVSSSETTEFKPMPLSPSNL